MDLSILITAWKEEKTIGKCLETLVRDIPSNISYEVILAAPDEGTYNAALVKFKELNIQDKLVYFKDPGKGKPTALNMIMDMAKGDIWFFGDGDTYFGKNVISRLLSHFHNENVMAVTGRPKSKDKKESMMKYYGNLLSDAAHHKRTVDLTSSPQGKGMAFVKKRKFFPVSGYIFAMRATKYRAPNECLVEDAYLSYKIHNSKGVIEYEPDAVVYVKFPLTLSDYFKQKKRSVGGYIQLWSYNIVNNSTKTRSLKHELEYFWFPIKYANNFRELIWSFCLYPIRLWLWLVIYWERKIIKKDFVKTWVRIESTK